MTGVRERPHPPKKRVTPYVARRRLHTGQIGFF